MRPYHSFAIANRPSKRLSRGLGGRCRFARLLRSACSLLAGLAGLLGAGGPVAAQETPDDFTIAFIGDQGLGSDAQAVLQLILDEGADAVVHGGDFDYNDDPAAWEAQIDAILGPDFPYFASVGNHDDAAFYGAGGYQEVLMRRMERLGVPWTGDLGVQSYHRYKGIFIVLTAPGVFGEGDGYHELFIRDALAADDSIWSVSSWHKNMTDMQVGGKGNETGWGVYEESRRGGAIIATGHEHSYSRTHLLSSMENQTIASTAEPLRLRADDPATPEDEGRTFAFVSGLGGKSIRDQNRTGDWWASIYTSDQGADHGALFGVFNFGGDPRLAYFYFKDIDGNVVDEFLVESTLGEGGVACSDGVDNDGDGTADFPGDLGCDGFTDTSERSNTYVCDDGADNDGDGRTDFPSDPDCAAPTGDSEAPPDEPTCDPADCDDVNPCTLDSCSAGACTHTPLSQIQCDDGDTNTIDDVCSDGVCRGLVPECTLDAECDDGNVCNGHETCGGTACIEGTLAEDGTPCEDGLDTTIGDSCLAGVCQGGDEVGQLSVDEVIPGAIGPGNWTLRIYGSGFELGAKLKLEKGKGPAPKVLSLRLLPDSDGQTLEADVHVSRNGPKQPGFFDVVVILSDGTRARLRRGLQVDR